VTVHGWAAALPATLAIVLAASPTDARPLSAIHDRGVLSLCAHANALPFASKTHEPPGFQIELGRALATALGVQLHVEWVTTGFQFRLVDCDIVLDTIAVPEAQAERRLELSRPYQRSGVGLAVRTDTRGIRTFDDVVGRRVGVSGRSLAAMILGRRGARLTSFGYEDEMLEAVVSGDVDAAAVSPAAAGYFMLRHPDLPLRFVHAYDAEPELRWDVAVGLRRADASFRAAIDAALDRLGADGSLGRIYSRYGVEYRPPVGR
jgi:polar amino acid transport system substrate-binding protein